jgi:hypothetical protein
MRNGEENGVWISLQKNEELGRDELYTILYRLQCVYSFPTYIYLQDRFVMYREHVAHYGSLAFRTTTWEPLIDREPYIHLLGSTVAWALGIVTKALPY